MEKGLGYGYSFIVILVIWISSKRSKVKKQNKQKNETKLIRLALLYSYHLPKLLVIEKYNIYSKEVSSLVFYIV